MSVNKDYVLNALLRHNYFPMQTGLKDELPPALSSETFSPEAARAVAECQLHRRKKECEYRGYDAVDYRLTRFTGVPRSCMIPHPTAYAHLALLIHDSWHRLGHIAENKSSLIRPHEHSDGRLIVMNYESESSKTRREMESAFGKRFVAQTDISTFFPSIYTHALAWAAVTFKEAKANWNKKNRWYNRLDEAARWLKRNETNGVAIGPASSNILSEIILARVDSKLASRFDFHRFIDDYTCYCATEEEAQEFIRRLSRELAEYKLALNGGKTHIEPLPRTASDRWIIDIRHHLPVADVVGPHTVRSFMDYSVQLAAKHPEGSVLKYALRSITGKAKSPEAKQQALCYAIPLAFHHPALMPLLNGLADWDDLDSLDSFSDSLTRIGSESAKFHRSDAMAWAIYYLIKAGSELPSHLVDEILRTRDCTALTILLLHDDDEVVAKLQGFAASLDTADLYELDQYWLFLYELFRRGLAGNPYGQDDTFEVLLNHGVAFLEEIS